MMRRVIQRNADDGEHADQAELLADHRQQEVGVRLGQPVQLLDAAAQADAEDLAAADGDQRVRQLVALAQRVLLAPRVEVGEDALAPPVRQRDHQHEGADHHQRDQEEHARVHAAQEQDAHRDHGDHHEGAHVRLGQQQHADDGHRAAIGSTARKKRSFTSILRTM
jgi:hypothetical protein